MRALLLLCTAVPTLVESVVYFQENFDDFDESRWITSTLKGSENAPYHHTPGEWYVDGELNKGLQTTLDHKHHSISAKLDAPFSNAGKTLVVQFSVKHELKEYVFCGGGYIKLHPPGLQQQSYGGDDKYNIMFGPDLCGYDVSRIHLIFTDHLGKNHERKPELKMDYEDKDEYTHLYTLILQPDQSYTVLIDNTKKSSGSLWDHYGFTKKTRDDPSDPKPSDWVDVAEILDPDDVKPDDWDLDHSERMVDPESAMPDDWDVDIDGDWHPATINNPDYKGPWRQKKIPNPEYKGPWKPTQLLNEHYDEGVGVYIDNAYVGFELWTVNHGSIFDNILITDDVELAKKEGEKLQATWDGEKQAKRDWVNTRGQMPEDEPEEEEEEPPEIHEEL